MTRAEHRRLTQFAAQGPACAVLLAKFLAERRRPKPSFRKAKKKAIEEWERIARQAVRLACELRANGVCEVSGCIYRGPLEMDHFYGRAFSESVETCWMLGHECHRAKTENSPSRDHWDGLFRAHCEKHGYPFKPRITKDIQVRHRRQRSPENPPSPLVAPSGLIKEHQ